MAGEENSQGASPEYDGQENVPLAWRVPENYEFRGYDYDLWKASTDEGLMRIEAFGVRDGYALRMYGVNRACVKKWVIDGKEIWAVYVRYSGGF